MAGLLLATMSAAHAEWRVRGVTGVPNDVRVWGPEVYSVSTNAGAFLFQADQIVDQYPPPVSATSAGTFLSSANCFISYWSSNSVRSQGCGANHLPIVDGVPSGVNRVQITGSGAAYALGRVGNAPGEPKVYFSAGSNGFQNRPWSESGVSLEGTPMALGVLRQGGSEHALVVIDWMSQLDFHWFVDGAKKSTYALPDSPTPPNAVQAIDLFPGEGTTPIALFSRAGGLHRGPLVNGTQPSFVSLPLPTPPGNVTGVDVNTGAGSIYGDGFGMVTVQHGGVASLLSAVPAGQPQEIGLQWRINPTFPTSVNIPRYVSCQGARFCVIAQNKDSPDNLLIYSNVSPPELTLDTGTTLPEGTMNRLFTIRASDPDGDAVRVVVSGSPTPALSLTQTEVPGGVDLRLTANAVCEDIEAPVTVAASDGFQGHDQIVSVPFLVKHTRRMEAPVVSPANTVAQAGGPAETLLATYPVAPSCTPTRFQWRALTTGAPELQHNGGSTAVFRTPDYLCERDGASYVYRVEAVDQGNLESMPRDFTVQVRPWGKPLAPFLTPRVVNLKAGDATQGSAVLTPDTPVHPCDQPAVVGFPGVDTVWDIADGASLPPGVQLKTQQGTVVTGTRAVTPELRVETQACAAAQLKLAVRHFTRDGSGIPGESSVVDVNVDPAWTPLENATLQVSTDLVTPEFVSGVTTVGNVNCIEERGGVMVRITLTHEDGTVIQGNFPPQAPWQLPIVPVCGGQRYSLAAELISGSPLQSAPVAVVQGEVIVPPVDVRLAPLEAPRVVATCGQAASGTLVQRLPPAPCQDVALSWTQVDGPELLQRSFTGPSIDITTKDAEFGELIGQEVVMRVTASTGQLQTSVDHGVAITAEPFVSVERSIENAVGTDTDLIGVSVELLNLTACGVREVDHMEHLQGADYIPGSARFNDAPVEASVEGEWLTAKRLVLEGNAAGRLTYLVRPRLLGSAKFEGQSFVRGVPVSQPLQVPVSEGCGCQGGGSGFAALALAGLSAVLRRRRAR
ncbi:MYXO-CTERM sorting domain-containing protein [Hyalangium gracile]|uniref:MYXO-CTERM sorting domain-containing protein n=1 Tax=Hyalangium gracile TaxID=394092 RepID=UPI001CCB4B49|nr:MYXO-CTERM sorting domain-containing protein [Hyalangium gracile]